MSMIEEHTQLNNSKSESGMMVVEAVISFMIFLMVNIAIIYLINIFTVHNRIQFAINSTANQIASYTYLYQALGIRSADQTFQNDVNNNTKKIDETTVQVADSVSKIQKVLSDGSGLSSTFQNLEIDENTYNTVASQLSTLKTDVQEAGSSVKGSAASLKELFSDPNALFVGIIYLGASRLGYEAKRIAASAAAGALCRNYLTNGTISADNYLKAYGILNGYEDLDFSGSTMLCDSGLRMIDIVVEYDIDMSFLKIFFPDGKLHMVNRVSVPAWLDGDGQTVTRK